MRSSVDDFDKLENRLRDSTLHEGSTMCATLALPDGWRAVPTPPSLFRRFQFDCYADTRAFLERLSALSQETGLYPDLGFGTTHVNVTLYGKDGQAPGTAEIEFASRATLAFTG
jgi:pterin-4a-carbinolamine dehydratase